MVLVNKEYEIFLNNNDVVNILIIEEVVDVVLLIIKLVRRKEKNFEVESFVRYRLLDFLGGLFIGYIEIYFDCEEIYIERIVCELFNGSSCFYLKLVKAGLFYLDEFFFNENGDFLFLWEKDCIIVFCYLDVVFEIC